MSFGNFFENIQVFVATGMGHNWLRTMKGQKRTKNETLVDLIQTFSFFNSLFSLEGRGSTPARGFVMLSSS